MDRRFSIAGLTCVLAMALGFSSAAHAAEYTWTPTAASANYNWDNSASQDNWGTGVSGLYPSAAGDIANLNIDILGNQTIRLQGDRTIAILNIGDLNGSHTTTLASGTGVNRLIFDSSSSAAAQLNVESNLAVTNVISADIVLNSNLNITLEPSVTAGNKASLNITAGFNLANHTVTVSGGYKGASDAIQLQLLGPADSLVGSGAIINNSDSPLTLTGDQSLFTGKLIANGQAIGNDGNSGTFTLNLASVRNASEIVINGAHDGTTQLGAKLQIGSGSTFTPPAHQRLTQNRITINGGLLNDAGIHLGDLISTGPNVYAYNYTHLMQQDDVANFNFNSAFSWVNLAASDTTAGNLLNVTTVERGQGATAFFRAASPATSFKDTARPGGYTYAAQFKAANGDTLVVGSTATSGNATRIIPWMIASTNVSNNGIASFATYDDAEGFRALRSGEYVVNTMTTGANVHTNGFNALASDFTINSLLLTTTATVSMDTATPVGRVLTIASGGLIFTNNAGSIGLPGNSDGRAGTLNFAAAEAVIFSHITNTNGIGAVIAGSGGLTKGSTGTLVLTGANTYTGKTNVSAGTLRVGDGTYASKLGDGDVRVHAGALLDIRSINVIDDSASLILDACGLFNGKVLLADSLIEQVAALYLADASQAPGYYGSSAAALANNSLSVNINDTYFSGNGLVYVPAPVPEPASLALLSAGGLLIFHRRRR